MANCKACHRELVKANRDANIERYREYDRKRADLPHRVEARIEYAATDRGRERTTEAKRAWIARNKDRRAAHVILNNAIKSGRVKRHPCEVCGATRSHAHHDDYAQPLEVRWLCATHHSLLHKTERRS